MEPSDMSDLHNQESEFSRLLERAPFDDALRPEHRQSLRQKALAEFDRSQLPGTAPSGWKHAFSKGREIMRRPVPRLIALTAACLAIAAVWLFAPGQETPAAEFRKLSAAVVGAK